MVDYTLSAEEAMTMLARALSLKHDRTEAFFQSTAVMRVDKAGHAELVEIKLHFYGERQSGLQNPQPASAGRGDSSESSAGSSPSSL